MNLKFLTVSCMSCLMVAFWAAILLIFFCSAANADLIMPVEDGKVVVSNTPCPIKYDDGFERSAYLLHKGVMEKACWQAVGSEYYIRMYEWQPVGIIHFGNYNFYKAK